MAQWPLLVFLGVRVACVALVQTWFVPDEYWQATEVAHSMAFRYGYKTWEWQEGIRGVLYPAVLAGVFKFLALLGADTPLLLIHVPRLLHALAFAVGDYHIWRLSKTLYGSASARWTAVCLSTSWFLGYCAPRTLTSCVETVLLAVAFSCYPWRREKESHSANYLWPVGLACAVRPTAAVPVLPLAIQHLWHSHHRWRLLLHYIMITTTLVVLTVVLDSWYYGELVVVPWRFIRFNVVSGLSAHYGTLPWHWYMSQGVPVILATHLLPFCLALYHQPARHQSLMSVILWSLLVYSCLGHKEFRFLLPVLPLCMCMAGDHIAFHLSAHVKRKGRPAGLWRWVVFLCLAVPNACALLYLGLVHQRGPLDVMQVLRAEAEAHPRPDVLFLMPCHSTPYYSHLHLNITMRFLTCEPNLKGEEEYLDEADLFDNDPLTWMEREYGNQPSLPFQSKGTEREEEKEADDMGSSRREEERVNSKSEAEEGRGTEGGDIGENRRGGGGTKGNIEDGNRKQVQSHRENIINESKTGEGTNMRQSPPRNLPSHLVMFSVLSGKIKEFLSAHDYHLCHELFHAHIEDGRRSKLIHVYCRARPRPRG
ncbi:GPI mannosyltransferase 3-like [Eriocheir sinensis]|uniref:GPI mannosyltransferase 3-like n=1 Tax=Eriocheir sinensis TaxID=95602 RepID=UPI0021C7D631|nr:GPI mannosyltransferase 3-like [Eriocheir sinensis]